MIPAFVATRILELIGELAKEIVAISPHATGAQHVANECARIAKTIQPLAKTSRSIWYPETPP